MGRLGVEGWQLGQWSAGTNLTAPGTDWAELRLVGTEQTNRMSNHLDNDTTLLTLGATQATHLGYKSVS